MVEEGDAASTGPDRKTMKGSTKMSTAVQFITRHPVIAGILLMCLLTWPIDLANVGCGLSRFPTS